MNSTSKEVEEEVFDETASFVQSRLRGGFNFDLAHRNAALMAKAGSTLPKFTKTGTTIVGLIFEGGVVLAADSRATAGPIVAQKDIQKLQYLAPNMYCAGAGTAADTIYVNEMISSQLALMRLNTGTESRVVMALTKLKRYLFRYMGYVSAALIVGGVDCTGPHLHTVWPHGSTDTLPYVTMGSGSLAAMAIFEAEYKPGMTREEGMELAKQAILSGINNDEGSGSNCNMVVMTRGKTEYVKGAYVTEIPHKRNIRIKYPRGTTVVLKREVIFHEDEAETKDDMYDQSKEQDVVEAAVEAMDVDVQ